MRELFVLAPNKNTLLEKATFESHLRQIYQISL
jgi:hypothetical protein